MKNLEKEDIIKFINSLNDKYSEKEVIELLISCYLKIIREEKLSHLLDEKEDHS